VKVLFITIGTNRVAASRYRVYQYLPFLNQRGIQGEVFSIISDVMTILSIRSPEFSPITRLIYYFLISIERFVRFWVLLFISARFDMLFLQRATFPIGLEKLLPIINKNIIYDIDDAIFLSDTQDRTLLSRFKAFIKDSEVSNTLKICKLVIVENDYIGKYVSRYCGNVYKIPGPIDTKRYFVRIDSNNIVKKNIIIGWIGSPATTGYLHLMDNVFRQMFKRFSDIEVVLIGAGKYDFPDKRVIIKKWDYETEVRELQAFDIGIMPMPDDDWTRGKLGCKMLQYMAVGVPSVVSYTDTNAEIIKDRENGFLVRTEAEWINRLSTLIEDKGLRDTIGQAGRRTVEGACSIQKNGPRLIEIFESLL